jgi:glycerol-3-phosphate dehydrogenase
MPAAFLIDYPITSVRVGGGSSKGHTDLDDAFVVHQDVGAGDAPVDQIVGFQEYNALKNLYSLASGLCSAVR